MRKARVSTVAVCIVILFGLTSSTEESTKEYAQIESTNNLIRAPQGQFIEWVLSLISQRPPFGGTTTTTTTEAISTAAQTTTIAPQRNCTDCVCGVANKKKRIVGGQETEVNQYPWMALLMYRTRFYCAASLINDLYVITASHCIHGFKAELITVRLLDHSRSMSHPNKVDRKVAEAIVHPKYNSRNFDSDIAILKLSERVEVKERLRPVCLPTPGKDFAGETGIVTGWGATSEGGPISDTLQEVHVPILSLEQCRGSKYGSSRISDNMLCAGYDEGKKDSCQGDSGGPLHIVDGEEHQLAVLSICGERSEPPIPKMVRMKCPTSTGLKFSCFVDELYGCELAMDGLYDGVVSWGEGCAKPNYPGVYARVNRFGSWIKSKTEDACYCHSEVKKFKLLPK